MITVCALASILIVAFSNASADGGELWGPIAKDPSVQVLSENYQAAKNAGVYCYDRDFILKTWHPINYFTGYYGDNIYRQCALKAAYGTVTTDGSDILELNSGQNIQAYHISTSSTNTNILQVPGAQSLFVGGGDYGLEAYDNPSSDFEIGPGATYLGGTRYQNEYRLKAGTIPRVLKDSSGRRITALHTIGASPNGKWLIIERGQQILRVKASDFSLLAFPTRVGNFNPSQAPNDALAVSNDGRYAAVAGGDGLNLMVYDLSRCVPNPSYNLTSATSCDPDTAKLPLLLNEQLGAAALHVDQLRFSDDGTQLFARVLIQDSSGNKRYELVALLAPGAKPAVVSGPGSNYIALGDSFASGEGAYTYFTGTDESSNKCHLSARSYPYLLGQSLGLSSVHSVACSGAKMVNVVGPSTIAAQFDERKSPKDNSLGNWLPGYNAQLQYIKDYRPDIVTISMVGNDIGFSDIIKHCINFGTCYSSYEERMGLVENINSKFTSLASMYAQIEAATPPDARVYVIGYPQIVEPHGDCGLNVHLNRDETKFATDLTSYLDDVIERAAARAGIGYVDVEDSFDGFRLCDRGSNGIVAVNGLTAGDDAFFHTIGNESYHPTWFGHQLLADTINAQTDNMTKPLPAINTSIDGPDMSEAMDLLDEAKTGVPIRQLEFDENEEAENGDTPLLRGAIVQGSLQGSDYQLEPKATYEVWLHSTPIKLGTVTADDSGNLSYSFKIPGDVEPGWHTIDIYGIDEAGNSIDVQRMIYIAASADDWDGDGIPNSQEPCGFFAVSGADVDGDSIDDACDGEIGLSKPVETPPLTDEPASSTSASLSSNFGNSIPTARLLFSASGKTVADTVTKNTPTGSPLNAATPRNGVAAGNTVNSTATHVRQKSSSKLWIALGLMVLIIALVAYILKLRQGSKNKHHA